MFREAIRAASSASRVLVQLDYDPHASGENGQLRTHVLTAIWSYDINGDKDKLWIYDVDDVYEVAADAAADNEESSFLMFLLNTQRKEIETRKQCHRLRELLHNCLRVTVLELQPWTATNRQLPP